MADELKGQGLRTPADFGPPVFDQGLYRPPRQRVVVSEQPPNRLVLVVSRIRQQGEKSWKLLDDDASDDERGGDADHSSLTTPDSNELTVFQHLARLNHVESELFG
jgi:hypothetical protein